MFVGLLYIDVRCIGNELIRVKIEGVGNVRRDVDEQ